MLLCTSPSPRRNRARPHIWVIVRVGAGSAVDFYLLSTLAKPDHLATHFVDNSDIAEPATTEEDPHDTTAVVVTIFHPLNAIVSRVCRLNIDMARLDVG